MMQLKKYNRMPATLGDIFAEAWPDYYFRRGTAPQVNVIESDRKFKIEIAAPGMSKDDLKIELTADGQLMVSLERARSTTTKSPKIVIRRARVAIRRSAATTCVASSRAAHSVNSSPSPRVSIRSVSLRRCATAYSA